MLYANMTEQGEQRSIAIVLDDQSPLVVTEAHPNFANIYSAVFTPEDGILPTDSELRAMADMVSAVAEKLLPLSAHVSIEGNTLLYDGERIDTALSRYLVQLVREDKPGWRGWVRFMERLAQNPSKLSRMHLFRWLRAEDFQLTDDGMIIGHKGVSRGMTSINTGPGIVNGQRMHGHLPNLPGFVLEMPREWVDTNRNNPCSVGLHVGTVEYASNFGGGVMVQVLVDPADVVSVPSDAGDAKMRVCRYVVVGPVDSHHSDDDELDEDLEAAEPGEVPAR